MLMTIYTGAQQVAAGTTAFAFSRLRVLSMGIVVASSGVVAAASAGLGVIIAATTTAATIWTVTSTVGILFAIPLVAGALTPAQYQLLGQADLASGTTVGVGIQGIGTSVNIGGVVVQGYLF
jgi:hypothetical protein